MLKNVYLSSKYFPLNTKFFDSTMNYNNENPKTVYIDKKKVKECKKKKYSCDICLWILKTLMVYKLLKTKKSIYIVQF